MHAIDLDGKLILKNSISRFPEGLTRDSLSEPAEAGSIYLLPKVGDASICAWQLRNYILGYCLSLVVVL